MLNTLQTLCSIILVLNTTNIAQFHIGSGTNVQSERSTGLRSSISRGLQSDSYYSKDSSSVENTFVYDEEKNAITPFTAFLGLMIFFTFFLIIAMVILMFSMKENKLISRYICTGITVKGDITSCTCAQRFVNQQEEDVEYICMVEYDLMAKDCSNESYKAILGDAVLRFRKQIKVKGPEILSVTAAPIPTRIQINSTISHPIAKRESNISVVSFGEEDSMPNKLQYISTHAPSSPKSTKLLIQRTETMTSEYRPPCVVTQQIHLLVLPEEPQSGFSKRQLEAKDSLYFRFPTWVLIGFFLSSATLAALCAIKETLQMESNAIICFSVAFVVSLAISFESVRRMDSSTTAMVEDQYFKVLDHMIMATHHDSASFSTMSYAQHSIVKRDDAVST